MTLGETEPSINDALVEFGSSFNLEQEIEDPPLIPKKIQEIKKPDQPKKLKIVNPSEVMSSGSIKTNASKSNLGSNINSTI